MTVIRMTLRTQKRRPHNQHVFNIRTMWCVAVHTVILHRFMFVNKRPALLGMAQIAGLINRSPDQGRRTIGTMRVVAIGAGYRTFPDRMSIRLVDFHFFTQMTGITNLCFGYGIKHLVPVCMYLVAGSTTQLLAGMGAVAPIDVIPLVARQADLTLYFATRIGLRTKANSGHIPGKQ